MHQIGKKLAAIAASAACALSANAGQDDVFQYQGSVRAIDVSFLNPYSNISVSIVGSYNTNIGSYYGGDGYDALLMSAQPDYLNIVNDFGVQVIDSVEQIQCAPGNDVIIMSHSDIQYCDVTILGNGGDDIIWSNSGDDEILGSNGNDIIDGGPGDDVINGDRDDDLLYGGTGNDTIYAGFNGNDVMYGDAGEDYLLGEAGGDWMSGGPGADSFALTPGDVPYVIHELPDGYVDTLEVSGNFPTFVRIGRDLQLQFTWPGSAGTASVLIRNQFDGLGSGIDQLRIVSDGSIVPLPRCPADYDASGGVNVADLFVFLDAWFAQVLSGGAPGTPSADFDSNLTVNVADLFAFLDAWFTEFGVCGV